MQYYTTTVRAFRWADLAPVAQLLADAEAVDRADYITTLTGLQEWLGQPNLRPEEDCLVAELGGWVVGWLQFVRELTIGRALADGVVYPTYRRQGIGRALLQRAMNQAYYLGARALHVAVRPHQEAPQQLLKGQIFSQVHKQQLLRLMDLDRVLLPALGGGFGYRSLRPGEEGQLAELQNAAFAGSWGYNPNTTEEIAYRLHMSGGRYENVHLVVRNDAPVAYCWTSVLGSGEAGRGAVRMMGVHPSFQGYGLGKAVLAAGICHLRRQGVAWIDLTVNEDNPSAINLYRSSGFERHGEVWWYEWRCY